MTYSISVSREAAKSFRRIHPDDVVRLKAAISAFAGRSVDGHVVVKRAPEGTREELLEAWRAYRSTPIDQRSRA